MKKTRIANFGFITFCVLFIGALAALSADTFQNNLLKADVYKSPIGGLKVVLFTSKPYNDSIIVNKKSDFEYVILMPETSNSMTAKPSLKFVDDVVKSFDVKTQQYANQVKGYTKIVISTTKPIEIASQVQTLKVADYKLAESDYKELLAQGVKNKTNFVKKEVAKLTQKPASTPAKTKAAVKTESVKKSTALKASKPNASVPKVVAKKVISKPIAQKVEQKPVSKVSETPTPVENRTPVESKVQPVQVEETAPVVEKIAESTAEVLPAKKVEVNNAFTFENLKKLIKNNFYTLMGALAALFILLLLVARKINRNQDQQKENFAAHLDEMPQTPTNYGENITEDMNWKEKFQTYVDASQSQQETASPQPEAGPVNPELDGLFIDETAKGEDMTSEPQEQEPEPAIETDFTQENNEEVFEETVEESELDSLASESEFGFQNASLDELFGEDEEQIEETAELEELEETQTIEEIQEIEDSFGIIEEDNVSDFYQEELEEQEDEFIQSEFVIDDEKGFYLVDFEDTTALVGHIGEEIFILKRFDDKIYAPIQARLNEHKAQSASFMVKVDNFRALVEVTPENMNLLIEL